LSKVLRDYQQEALRFIWKSEGKGLTSRMVHSNVKERLDGGKSISRASIINFLNAMVDEGVLDYIEETAKGGYRRVYSAKFDEAGFKRSLAESFILSLMKDFPLETSGVIKEYFELVSHRGSAHACLG
jgi:predicted transcriptional regulator